MQKKDAWGLISYEGELTVPCVFDYLNYNKDGVYYFKQTIENEDKYGLIDNHGVILSPAQWDYMSHKRAVLHIIVFRRHGRRNHSLH